MDLLARSPDDCNCISKHFQTATGLLALFLSLTLILFIVAVTKLYHVRRRIKRGDEDPFISRKHFDRRVQQYGQPSMSQVDPRRKYQGAHGFNQFDQYNAMGGPQPAYHPSNHPPRPQYDQYGRLLRKPTNRRGNSVPPEFEKQNPQRNQTIRDQRQQSWDPEDDVSYDGQQSALSR